MKTLCPLMDGAITPNSRNKPFLDDGGSRDKTTSERIDGHHPHAEKEQELTGNREADN